MGCTTSFARPPVLTSPEPTPKRSGPSSTRPSRAGPSTTTSSRASQPAAGDSDPVARTTLACLPAADVRHERSGRRGRPDAGALRAGLQVRRGREPDPVPLSFAGSHSLSIRPDAVRAGNAGHAGTPAEGHGINRGLRDAFNLGWKLALVCRGQAGAGQLDTYEAERRPLAERYDLRGQRTRAETRANRHWAVHVA